MNLNPASDERFNDIWHRVAELRKGATELDLKRIERDIDLLVRADLSGSLELRGFICAFRGNLTEAQKLVERARVGSDGAVRTAVRFLLVLYAARETELMLAIYASNRDLIRNDIAAIRTVSGLLASIGRLEEAKLLVDEALRLGETVEIRTFEDREAGGESDLMLSESMNDDDTCARELPKAAREVVEFVEGFLSARGREFVRPSLQAIELEDGSQTTLISYELRGSSEEIADIEWDLFGELDPTAYSALSNREVVVALVSAG